MESFVFSYPTRVYFGSGAAKQALDSELGAYKKVMLAYGVASAKANGIYDEIRGALESLGKEVVDFGGITPNPKYTKVQEGAALARREQVDFILAVGGGSVSDCCKVISAQAVLDDSRALRTMSTSGASSPRMASPWASSSPARVPAAR